MSDPLKISHLRRVSSKSNVNCSVYGCTAVSKNNPELSFHKFPPPGQKITVMVPMINGVGGKCLADRRKMWEMVLRTGRPATPYMHVCSRHFTPEDYTTPLDNNCYARRFLKKMVVPTQNLPSRKAYCNKKVQKSVRKTSKQLDEERKLKDETRQEDYSFVVEYEGENGSSGSNEPEEILGL